MAQYTLYRTYREKPCWQHDRQHDKRDGCSHEAQRGQRQSSVQVAPFESDRHHEALQIRNIGIIELKYGSIVCYQAGSGQTGRNIEILGVESGHVRGFINNFLDSSTGRLAILKLHRSQARKKLPKELPGKNK